MKVEDYIRYLNIKLAELNEKLERTTVSKNKVDFEAQKEIIETLICESDIFKD